MVVPDGGKKKEDHCPFVKKLHVRLETQVTYIENVHTIIPTSRTTHTYIYRAFTYAFSGFYPFHQTFELSAKKIAMKNLYKE